MIKTAQERVAHSQALTGRFAIPMEDAMHAEIADLRTALAAKLVPMTPDEIVAMAKLDSDYDDIEQFERMVRAVEAHHGRKL